MRSFFREKAFIRSMGFGLESSAAEQQKKAGKFFLSGLFSAVQFVSPYSGSYPKRNDPVFVR